MLLFLLLLSSVSGQLINFTGNAREDFAAVFLMPESFTRNYVVIPNSRDVEHMEATGYTKIDSGMDILGVHLLYDWENDDLYVGVDCNGICGDADGDGDPSSSSVPSIHDEPDMCQGESFAMLLWPSPSQNWKPSVINFFPSLIVGINQADCLSDWRVAAFDGAAECPLPLDTPSCASEQTLKAVQVPDSAWGDTLQQLQLFAMPSAETPDLEFRIQNFSTLTSSPWQVGLESWTMGISWISRGGANLTEDFENPLTLDFLCPAQVNGTCVECQVDMCGECGGANETCVCDDILGTDFALVDAALLRWSVGAARDKTNKVLTTLRQLRSQWELLPSDDEISIESFLNSVRNFCGDCLDSFDLTSSSFADRLAGHYDSL